MGKSVYLLIIVFVISIILLLRLEKYEVKYVKSSLNNKEYLVRDMPDSQQSADLISQMHINLNNLVNTLYQNKDTKYKQFSDVIDRLNNQFKTTVINESSENNSYTSYSVNKGEQIVFCLRSKYNNQLHDINLLMYVALHELAHIGCKSYGHTDEFKNIFAFLINVSTELNIYQKIDFKNKPIEYCGLVISEHI